MDTLIDKLFRDTDGNIVIWQAPNLPLWIWIISIVLGFALHGTLKTIDSAIGSVALVVWSVMEIASGRSLFRRIVGTIVLVVIITGFLRNLT